MILSLLLACPPARDDTGEADTTPFACDVGPYVPGGPFRSFLDAPEAELTLGFQGLLMIQVQGRLDAGAPPIVDVTMSVAAEGASTFSGIQPYVSTVEEDGARLTAPIVVFFTSADIGFWTGRSAVLGLRFEHAARACTWAGTIQLVDEDDCIRAGDTVDCPDDTGGTAR